MTIYTDAAGNKYLGDCRWGNHDIDYPSTNYLLAHPHNDISQGLSDLCTAAGINVVTVMSQANFNAYQTAAIILSFRFPGDTGSGSYRYAFSTESSYGGAQGNSGMMSVRATNDSGSTVITGRSNGFFDGYNGNGWGLSSTSVLSWSGVATSDYISLVVGSYTATRSYGGQYILCAGTLRDVNTNFNYYSEGILQSSFLMCGKTTIQGGHYIVTSQKNILQSGRAAYTISCSDGQTPGAQWATDMWVYDNNVYLGYPVIGRVPNMLLGIGDYTYLKPVKIGGSVFPDNGSPWYLPVGTFSGKTLLMRCYSSVS